MLAVRWLCAGMPSWVRVFLGWVRCGAVDCAGEYFTPPSRVSSETAARVVHVFSMHTDPFAQPGSGDAGGMNVYIARSVEAMLAAEHAMRRVLPAAPPLPPLLGPDDDEPAR